jgi:hypothetical protein
MAFGMLALLLMLVLYSVFHYGVPILYERGLTYETLTIGIVAGAGFAWLKGVKVPVRAIRWAGMPMVARNAGYFICAALIALAVTISIPARLNTPFYHMIDKQDY